MPYTINSMLSVELSRLKIHVGIGYFRMKYQQCPKIPQKKPHLLSRNFQ